jgi:hypothetical protein
VVAAAIDEPQRIAIPHGKALQAQRIGVVRRTDEHDAAVTMVQKPHPAQNEGPHEDLAEIRFRRHHAADVPVQDPDNPSLAQGSRGDEHGTRADVIQFTSELPGPMDGQGFLTAISARPGDRDFTLDHEKEIGAALAAVKQSLAWADRLLRTVRGDPRYQLRWKLRENLGGAGVRVVGRRRFVHGPSSLSDRGDTIKRGLGRF